MSTMIFFIVELVCEPLVQGWKHLFFGKFDVSNAVLRNYTKENEVNSGFGVISHHPQCSYLLEKVFIMLLMTISSLALWVQVNVLLNITSSGALPRCQKWFQSNCLATQLHERGVWITIGIHQGFVKHLKCHFAGKILLPCKQFISALSTCSVSSLFVLCLEALNFWYLALVLVFKCNMHLSCFCQRHHPNEC